MLLHGEGLKKKKGLVLQIVSLITLRGLELRNFCTGAFGGKGPPRSGNHGMASGALHITSILLDGFYC